jgi:hypothetical protein
LLSPTKNADIFPLRHSGELSMQQSFNFLRLAHVSEAGNRASLALAGFLGSVSAQGAEANLKFPFVDASPGRFSMWAID